MTEYIDIANSIITSWKKFDVDGVLSVLHEDVEFHYAIGQRPLVGKTWVGKFLEKFGQGQTEIKWRIVKSAVSGNTLMVEGIDEYIDADGNHIVCPYAGIFEFKDGLVWRWRDYVDTQLMVDAKSGKARSKWLDEFLSSLDDTVMVK